MPALIFLLLAMTVPPAAQGGGKGCFSATAAEKLEALLSERRALRKQGYQGKKPVYENPGTHDVTNKTYNPKKTPLPDDAAAVYRRAVPEADGKTWWGWSDACGCWYRFQGGKDVKVAHWNGLTRPGESSFRLPGGVKPEQYKDAFIAQVDGHALKRRDVHDRIGKLLASEDVP